MHAWKKKNAAVSHEFGRNLRHHESAASLPAAFQAEAAHRVQFPRVHGPVGSQRELQRRGILLGPRGGEVVRHPQTDALPAKMINYFLIR